MDYEQIINAAKSALWSIKAFVKDQLGALIMFVVVILCGVWWGEYKSDKGKEESKDQISELNKTIKYREVRIAADSVKILKYETKIDTLQTKLAMRDCTEEMERANRFLKKMQIENAIREEEIRRRVEFEKRKTQEMLKMKINIKNNL